MAFAHGKQTRILVDEYDLSGYFKRASTRSSVDLLDATTFNATHKAFQGGFEDGQIQLEGLHEAIDVSIKGAAEILSDAFGTGTRQLITIGATGVDTVGDLVKLGQAEMTSHDVSSSIQDLVLITASMTVSEGIRQGVILAPLTARTATADGSSVDNTAETNNGAVAHLHVTAASGTTPTMDVFIEHSDDEATWSTLMTFTQAADETSERLTSSGEVKRYLRASWTVAGTDPSFTFAVALARL